MTDRKNDTETTLWIGVLPPKDISDLIMEAKKDTGVYYPDHEDSLPHATLYSCKFDETKLKGLVEELKKIDTAPFTAVVDKLTLRPQMPTGTFISLNFVNAEDFIDLHKKVLAITNPLRGDLIRTKDVERYREGRMTEDGWKRTQKYGFQYFMDKYYPHMTIGVVHQEDEKKAPVVESKLKSLENRSFAIEEIRLRIKERKVSNGEVVSESEVFKIPLR